MSADAGDKAIAWSPFKRIGEVSSNPEGVVHHSPGLADSVGQPWGSTVGRPPTLKGLCKPLIPNVALVEFDTVFPEQTPKFVLK